MNKFFNEFLEYFQKIEFCLEKWLKSEISQFDLIFKENNLMDINSAQLGNNISDK